MLQPNVKLRKENTYCTCGKPNFRHNYEVDKPIYDIYEVTIPTVPCGSKTFKLCADCLKLLQPPNEPLTLEELKQMDGEPVRIEPYGVWALIMIDNKSGNVGVRYKSGLWDFAENVFEENKIYRHYLQKEG